MAGRIRSIKPEILDDDEVMSLSDEAWRMWVSMFVLADDHGNLPASERFLASRVFQDSSRRLAASLGELRRTRRVELYAVDGKTYAHIRNWNKHQRIDNAGKKKVPLQEEGQPCETFAENLGEPPRDSASRGDTSAALLWDGMGRDRIGGEGSAEGGLMAPSPTDPKPSSETREQEDRVFVHWADRLYPGSKVKFDDKRRKRIRARLSDGFTADDLKLAIDGATKDNWIMGLDAKARKGGYRDIETVFRDVAQVERLMGLTTEGQRRLSSGPQKRRDGSVDGVPAKTVKEAPQAILVPIGPRQEFRGPKTPAELALMDNLMSKIGAGPPKSNGHAKSAIGGETLEDRALASRAALARMGETK